MYGRIRPARPWASWTVATPSSPSWEMMFEGGRAICRMILGFIRHRHMRIYLRVSIALSTDKQGRSMLRPDKGKAGGKRDALKRAPTANWARAFCQQNREPGH